jgi:esterase/lipase superfamily enzyme
MHREYHKWFSPALQRNMELLIFGHAGARVLVFPTSQGRFYEWQDRGIIDSFAHHIEQGWLQFYCVDSVDAESWYAYWAHPGGRAYRHHQYFMYLLHEVLPLSRHRNGNPFLITTGASFGAFHAMSFGLKYPNEVDRIIGMSGVYDIRFMTRGYSDDWVYAYNPVEFIPNEHDHHRLEQIQHLDIIMTTGKTDRLHWSSQEMTRILWDKGIGNALREWDGWAHDWPYWEQMLHMYIDGHD